MQNYLTLTVVISSGPDDKLRVRANSVEGQGNANISYIEIQDFAGLATGITRSSRAIASAPAQASAPTDSQPQNMANELGTALFDALFQGPVRDVLRDTVSAAQDQSEREQIDTAVRIRLVIDLEDQKTAEVANLPWELMRADKNAGSPLVLSSEATLVRSIDVPKSTVIRPLQDALRILLIKSNPMGTTPLELDQESSELKRKIEGLGNVEVDEVPPQRNAILKKLKDKKYHIVHYMGHGDFTADGGGMLLLEDEDGNESRISSEEFKIWMQHPSLRLVFLNACNTGTTGDDLGLHPFSGVATALISSGVPAVIAMQFPISDGAAIDFSETFYERLAQGLPVEAAVTEGRKKMLTETEWATPVLYLRAKDGNLFARTDEPVSLDKDTEEAPTIPPAAAVPETLVKGAPREEAISSGKKLWTADTSKLGIIALGIAAALFLVVIVLVIPSDDGAPVEADDTAQTSDDDPGGNAGNGPDISPPVVPDEGVEMPGSPDTGAPPISRDIPVPAPAPVDDSDDDDDDDAVDDEDDIADDPEDDGVDD